MAASTGGAIKAWVEAGGLGLAVYRSPAPDSATYPFVTVDERISLIPEAHGDNGQGAAVTETIQVNLWQRRTAESHTLLNALIQRLHGVTINGPTHVYGVRTDFASTVPDPDPQVVHDQITCSVRRALQEA